ncbi:MAG: hypothetical protein A3F72_10230 [Bacteroidetes bacterium RIFCSPLOWO2_12_FULL_35_15]|nr:MAG: hypothetical protein A3F72_10230 [Bacteroidetes bacterium RIFCSPLOWO2_12_FULL_35_15]
MNFKIGDKVRFLNEKGEGEVSKIINKTTVGITIEEGFEIPFLVSDLILIDTGIQEETKATLNKKSISLSTSIPSEIKIKSTTDNPEEDGIYIAFSPEKVKDIAHSDFNVWLINHTTYKILFSYSILQNGNYTTIESGELAPLGSMLIETIDRKVLDEYSVFKIDAIYFNEEEHEYQLPISEVIKLKPIKLYKDNAFVENSFISEKALIINVSRLYDFEAENEPAPKADLSKILFQKQNYSGAPKKSKPHSNNNPANELEIDLHIEELLDNYSGMSNAEIIQIQLKHFQKFLDKAINGHYRKLVVIHGVGNGRLKQEVRTILSSYNNLRFYDGSYSKYGFGATEVIIS